MASHDNKKKLKKTREIKLFKGEGIRNLKQHQDIDLKESFVIQKGTGKESNS